MWKLYYNGSHGRLKKTKIKFSKNRLFIGKKLFLCTVQDLFKINCRHNEKRVLCARLTRIVNGRMVSGSFVPDVLDVVMLVPAVIRRYSSYNGHGFDYYRRWLLLLVLLLPLVRIFAEADVRITEKPGTGDRGGRRKRDGRGRPVVSVRCGRRCRSVQEPNVFVKLRVIGHGGCGSCGRSGHSGMFDAADERIDKERSGHGFFGCGRHCHGWTGTFVHCANARNRSTEMNCDERGIPV